MKPDNPNVNVVPRLRGDDGRRAAALGTAQRRLPRTPLSFAGRRESGTEDPRAVIPASPGVTVVPRLRGDDGCLAAASACFVAA